MLRRAYSLLDIKAVQEDERIIVGVATTPETDRMGDIVEPEGAQFKLPIPLLWQHNAREPIGEVFSARVTKAGIEVKARVFKIDEPGTLKDRLDEAWQSLKIKLVRGLSIGFQSVESARIEGTYGIRFLKWLWLELSAVTIPANAEATITAIKSLDVGCPAATGHRQARVSAPPRVRGSLQSTPMNKNISEKLTAKKADLKTKSEALEALIEKDELDAAEQEDKATLTEEVRALAADIDSLEALELAALSKARPVVGKSGDEAGRSRGATSPGGDATHEDSRIKNRPKGVGFAQAVICRAASLVSGEPVSAIAKEHYGYDPRVAALARVLKAPVAGGSTITGEGATWGSSLADPKTLQSEFIEFLRPQTIIGKFGQGSIPSLRTVPFNVRINSQTSGGAGYWVGEAKQKPLTSFGFDAVTLGFAKVASIAVISDELARFSNPSAEGLVRDALSEALIERLDIDFIDPDKVPVANVSPASITNGILALPSTGTDAASIRADIKSLLSTFVAANINPMSLVFIMPNTVALALSLLRNELGQREFPDITMNGGTLEGIPVIASQYAVTGSPGNLVIAASARDIFLSDDGQVSVDVSREASLEMSNDPENESGSVVSMYQTNQLALRAERYINWQRRRSTAVAYMENVQWGEGSPA